MNRPQTMLFVGTGQLSCKFLCRNHQTEHSAAQRLLLSAAIQPIGCNEALVKRLFREGNIVHQRHLSCLKLHWPGIIFCQILPCELYGIEFPANQNCATGTTGLIQTFNAHVKSLLDSKTRRFIVFQMSKQLKHCLDTLFFSWSVSCHCLGCPFLLVPKSCAVIDTIGHLGFFSTLGPETVLVVERTYRTITEQCSLWGSIHSMLCRVRQYQAFCWPSPRYNRIPRIGSSL